MKFNKSQLSLFIIFSLFGFLLISQISSGKPGSSKIYTFQNYKQAVSELNKLNDEVNQLKNQQDELEQKLAHVSNQSSTSETIKQFEDDLKNYEFNEGLTDVEGPGVIVTVADSAVAELSPDMIDDPAELIVHNWDLAQLVWQLKEQGAEAISINGQRITSGTEISCVGAVIKINGEKTISPFEIKAIGDPSKLSYALENDYSVFKTFQDRRLEVNYIKNQNIKIPKYSGNIGFKYAQTVK